MHEWDEAKRLANLAKHGVDFSTIESFDRDEAVITQDTPQDYGEARYTAFGPINGRPHCVYFTIRGDNYRITGLRKANNRKIGRYGQKTDIVH